jgi:hypothetical protein
LSNHRWRIKTTEKIGKPQIHPDNFTNKKLDDRRLTKILFQHEIDRLTMAYHPTENRLLSVLDDALPAARQYDQLLVDGCWLMVDGCSLMVVGSRRGNEQLTTNNQQLPSRCLLQALFKIPPLIPPWKGYFP